MSRKVDPIVLHCSATRPSTDVDADRIRRWYITPHQELTAQAMGHTDEQMDALFGIGTSASEEARFPEPIINPADGEVELPK